MLPGAVGIIVILVLIAVEVSRTILLARLLVVMVAVAAVVAVVREAINVSGSFGGPVYSIEAVGHFLPR